MVDLCESNGQSPARYPIPFVIRSSIYVSLEISLYDLFFFQFLNIPGRIPQFLRMKYSFPSVRYALCAILVDNLPAAAPSESAAGGPDEIR